MGGTISLTASGGSTYSWRDYGTFSSTTASISRSATTAAAGIYSVTAYNGICTATQTVSVAVTAVSITAGQTNGALICSGANVSLTVTNGQLQYAWSGPAGFNSTAQNPILLNVTTAMTGNYTVSATATCGVLVTSSVKVTVKASPTPTITSNSPVCIGSTLKLTASAGSGYAWAGPAGFSSAIQKPSITLTTLANSGTYTLTITAATSCTASTQANLVVQNCTGARIAIDTEKVDDVISLEVSPNPTTGKLFVVVRLATAQGVSLKLADQRGLVRKAVELGEETTVHHAELDLSDFREGTYLLSAQTQGHIATKRVLKTE
ncbi:MAG: T9SS type A sorting domain-containing protein [Spirosomataceae bacterium]